MQALPGQVTPEGVPSFKLVLVGDGGTGVISSPKISNCNLAAYNFNDVVVCLLNGFVYLGKLPRFST